jgi:hypothetical protein
MLKKFVSKFTVDILPSVLATIIGAYIVNHYIVTKPDAPAAAVVSTPGSTKADAKTGSAADVAAIPEAGVKAKGVSEKALLEKTASERPAAVDRPAETTLPSEPHRVQPVLREKPAAKAAQTAAPPAPVPVEAAPAPQEKRDATDLARAAIERLRGTSEAQPHVQEVARVPEASRISEAAKVTPPAAQPLPPPIMVSTPGSDAFNPATGSLPSRPAHNPVQVDDPQRPTPPADIPSSARPLDLRAEVAEFPLRQRTSVAEDVLSAAKSVFHAVLPR